MFLKSTLFVSAFALFALLPASYGHAIASPPLGVNGTPARSDVKRPSSNQPCGSGINIASSLDTSNAVPTDGNGKVTVTLTNFNGGPDGSRQVTAMVDPSGTGKNFVTMTVLVNGDPAPKNVGPQDIVAQLPARTQCTGGAQKNICLVQFVTTSGFGNCVAVSQNSNAANNSSTSSDVRAASPTVKGDGAPAVAEKNVDGKQSTKPSGQKNNGKGTMPGSIMQPGTRAARAVLANLARGPDVVDHFENVAE